MLSFVQCVTISSCGNFTIVGDSSGHVDIYNVQSGLHRGSLGKDKGTFLNNTYFHNAWFFRACALIISRGIETVKNVKVRLTQTFDTNVKVYS